MVAPGPSSASSARSPAVVGQSSMPVSPSLFAFPSLAGRGGARYDLVLNKADKCISDGSGIVDSGASAHITGDRSLFRGLVRTCCVPVVGVAGSTYATGVGSGLIRVGGLDVPLTRMYFVPSMGTTLLSVSELVEAGCEVVAKKVNGVHAMELVVPSGGRCVLPVKGGLYPVEGGGLLGGQYFESELEGCGVRGCVAVSGAAGTKLRGNSHVGSIPLDELLHRRLGHVSWQSSRLAGRLRAVFGAKLGRDHKSASCEACVLAKMKQSFSRSPPTRPATRPLERVHIDFVPSIPTFGPHGVTGFLLIVAEYTGMYFVHLLHRKSELPGILQKFKLASERHFRSAMGTLLWPVELGCVRSDGEAVMVSGEMQGWCDANGVRWELSAPYAQWQNGKAERAVQTLWQGAEAMRKAAGAPPHMWAYTVQAFAHTHNRLATGDSDRSPWELWNNTVVPLSERLGHLRTWGCKAYAYVPRSQRRRLDDRARVCMLVGYSEASKAYLLLDLRTFALLVSASVVFDETRLPLMAARESRILSTVEPAPVVWPAAVSFYPAAAPPPVLPQVSSVSPVVSEGVSAAASPLSPGALAFVPASPSGPVHSVEPSSPSASEVGDIPSLQFGSPGPLSLESSPGALVFSPEVLDSVPRQASMLSSSLLASWLVRSFMVPASPRQVRSLMLVMALRSAWHPTRRFRRWISRG